MPVIKEWFDESVELPWEYSSESPLTEEKGPSFKTFPLSWLVPYATPDENDLKDSDAPIWISEIHPKSPYGKVVDSEGTFIINLPKSFDEYRLLLQEKDWKKFQENLKKNKNLTVIEDQKKDIDVLWGFYIDRVQALAAKAGGDLYTEEELLWRYRFLTQNRIKTISFYESDRLYAVNISLIKDKTVYDLACIINPVPEALKRSLGTTAILKNIEIAIRDNQESYDLLSRDYGYKKQFGAVEHKMKALIIGDDSFFAHYKIPLSLRWSK